MAMEKRSVCIDAGHPSLRKDGSVNWGAQSVDGIRELEINLIIAELVRDRLTGRFKVTLTREDNEKIVDNTERVRIAHENGAELLIRLHCDWAGLGNLQGSGVRTFYPPRQAISISRRSESMARTIHDAIISETKLRNGGVWDDTIGKVDPALGMWVGSFEANKVGIPVVLVEMVYLSNPSDTKWITNPVNQQCMANAIAKGIIEAFDIVPE